MFPICMYSRLNTQHTHVVPTVRLQDSSVMKDLALLTHVQCKELVPFIRSNLVYAITCYVRDFPYLIEVRSRTEELRVPRLMTVSPKASGSLRNANSRKENLSRNTKRSTHMHIIFSPFTISSTCHFRRIAHFRIKWRSKAFALLAITTILSTQGSILQR